MELALKIRDIKDLDDPSGALEEESPVAQIFREYYEDNLKGIDEKNISRIYFGSEFCQYLIPDREKISEIVEECKHRNLQVTYLTPPVNDNGIKKLMPIFEYLQCENAEVTINDTGVLELLYRHFPGIKVNYGRLMDKTCHDGRFNRYDLSGYCNEEGQKYFTQTAYQSEGFKNILKKYNVHLLELDYPLHCLNPKYLKENQYAVYLPYGFLTTGRVCMAKNINTAQEKRFQTGESGCSMQCRNFVTLMSKQVNPIKFYNDGRRQREQYLIRKGNTIFYFNEMDLQASDYFGRVILQPYLML